MAASPSIVVDGDPVQTQEDVKVKSPLQAALSALADRERAEHGVEVGDFLVASRALDEAIKSFITFAIKAGAGEISPSVQFLVGNLLTRRLDEAVSTIYVAGAQLKYGLVAEHEADIDAFMDLQARSSKEWADTVRSFDAANDATEVSGEAVPDSTDEDAPSIVLP